MRKLIENKLQYIRRKPEMEKVWAHRLRVERAELERVARESSDLGWKCMVNEWRRRNEEAS